MKLDVWEHLEIFIPASFAHELGITLAPEGKAARRLQDHDLYMVNVEPVELPET